MNSPQARRLVIPLLIFGGLVLKGTRAVPDSLFLVLTGALMVLLGLAYLPTWFARRSYKAVEGKLIRFPEKEKTSQRSWLRTLLDSASSDLVYEYEIDGQRFTGSSDSLHPYSFRYLAGDNILLAQLSEKFLNDEHVVVFFDRRNPHRSALTVETDWLSVGTFSCIGAVLITFGYVG